MIIRDRGIRRPRLIPTLMASLIAANLYGANHPSSDLQFNVISPKSDGTISVEPLKGTGSATFTRATTAYVRDYQNVYHEISAGTPRIQGARYSGGVFYWQLADGTPLRPTVSKNGATVFANYQTRANLTAYALNDRMIPATGSGPAGGNGYWYYVSAITTGTSGGSAPTYPTTIGASIVDGGITLTCGGYYTVAGYKEEPAATNNAIYSRDFTNAAWVATNITTALDATGIDGVANSASTLTASAGLGTIFQTITLASAAYCTSFFVKRKTGTGTIEITDDGGTTYTDITASLSSTEYLEFYTSQTQANPQIGFRITTSGDAIYVDMAGCIAGSIPSSPIPTTTAAVTRNEDILKYQVSGNLNESTGTVICSVNADSWENSGVNARVIGTDGSTARLIASFYGGPSQFNAYDSLHPGPNILTSGMTGNKILSVSVRWSGSSTQISSEGTSGAAATYYGTWNLGTNIVAMGRGGSGGVLQGCITDIRIYNIDLGQTKCEAATAYD